ncbi:SAM-dependent methyltransferase [Hyphomonas sp. CACIAM 19H1]|uniref:methyltransferase domain-containing protein n=1 Tax=Hyphomonas sp. CACIAM 19H1 TaxID=1873716 RepID=UPI000DEDA87A|nr:methyltransferase domain-containing protein [Hyphomonas sp. CACIAM 19H1]AXE65576.1 SAM-dependent methyltransferase [Hyphomonas sp. CACIAM 19H1]
MPPSPQSPSPPQIFDRDKLRRRRQAFARHYQDYDFLRARVSSDLETRVADTPRIFETMLELGGADGGLSRTLLGQNRTKSAIVSDTADLFLNAAAAGGLEAVFADEEALQFEPERFDLVVSPLTLHWVNDLPGALVQIRRILKPDGLFLGALFGAGTLAELREVMSEAETELTGGLSPRLSPLPGLRDMAGLLQRAGFALPVVDRDTVTVRYKTPEALLRDLKGMGERAAFVRGVSRPLPRRVLARAMDLYKERFSDPDGRVRATFEIVHLSGWAPAPGQPQPLKPGSARASMADAVRRAGRPDSEGTEQEES